MVPVLKRSTGKACICIDLKKLNEAVKREQYILPTTDEMSLRSMPPVGSSRYHCTQTAVSSLSLLRHLADSTSTATVQINERTGNLPEEDGDPTGAGGC